MNVNSISLTQYNQPLFQAKNEKANPVFQSKGVAKTIYGYGLGSTSVIAGVGTVAGTFFKKIPFFSNYADNFANSITCPNQIVVGHAIAVIISLMVAILGGIIVVRTYKDTR